MAHRGHPSAARLSVAIPAAMLVATLVSVGSWLPALVHRFAVDPNPLRSEGPFLARSIAATRSGLGLDEIEAHRYSPKTLRPSDVWRARSGLADVGFWDSSTRTTRTTSGTPCAPRTSFRLLRARPSRGSSSRRCTARGAGRTSSRRSTAGSTRALRLISPPESSRLVAPARPCVHSVRARDSGDPRAGSPYSAALARARQMFARRARNAREAAFGRAASHCTQQERAARPRPFAARSAGAQRLPARP